MVCALTTLSLQPTAEATNSSELRECDRFMESYVRSSARKLWRALSDDYNLEPLQLDETLEFAGIAPGGDEPRRFEVLLEQDGKIAGVVDRTREFERTYIIAHARFGPIIVSQTWQPRHLRDQGCEPVGSAVEFPRTVAPTVDIEPFHYWGLRASWRIPSPEGAEPTDHSVEEVLVDLIEEFADPGEEDVDESLREPVRTN